MNGMDLETEWMLYQLDPSRMLEYMIIRRNLILLHGLKKINAALVETNKSLASVLNAFEESVEGSV